MGIKRSRSEAQASGDDHMHPSRKRARDDRPHKTKPRKPVDLDSVTAIKKRARAIERLLAHNAEKLPAHKTRELERELAAHKRRIADAQYKKKRAKMISKYHMVRFFERKKAIRIAKQLEKKLAQATDADEIAKLKEHLHKAQVDIDYAIYYPFMEPYISLYAKPAAGEEEKAAQYLHTERPPMWALIEKTREEGKHALERLQNRKSEEDAEGEEAEDSGKKSSKKSKAEKDEESDDGGFFDISNEAHSDLHLAALFAPSFTMTLNVTRPVPSFHRLSFYFHKLRRTDVQLGLNPSSFAQDFLLVPRPTLPASKAYRSPSLPQVAVRFITIMTPRRSKRKLGQFIKDTIVQAQTSPKRVRPQQVTNNNISTMASAPAANDDGIDYQSLASFIEQQIRDPRPITPFQRRLLTELTSSIRDEEPDIGGHDWISLLQRYTDAHKALAGTNIGWKDVAVNLANGMPAPGTKWNCSLTFQNWREHNPQIFPLNHQVVPGGFGKKKDAKKYAAKCCVEWLMKEGLMPKDGLKVTWPLGTNAMMAAAHKIYGPLSQPSFSSSPNPHVAAQSGHHQPSSNPHLATPSSSTTPTQQQFQPAIKPTDSTLSLDNGGAPLDAALDEDEGEEPTKRVAALCEKLGMRAPRYALTQRAVGMFDGYADMGADSWVVPEEIGEGNFGRVEGVCSKKIAKEMIAQGILGVLEEVLRKREADAKEFLGR
ncbi:hypothetical protein QBC40DRAFT_309837 [Triangularia verruculosa]|uniref:rRNA-processing protein EFG1 n=1 Tax=Triangularia verruculosa TaxID=2587418 RepID=A0AAN7AS43_9PEZI|nr:hypothetical protein QBC40DRAFT_309837 [Triangularia verruculosa]